MYSSAFHVCRPTPHSDHDLGTDRGQSRGLPFGRLLAFVRPSPIAHASVGGCKPSPGTDTIESAVFALFTLFIFTLKTNTVSALIFLFIATASLVLAGA